MQTFVIIAVVAVLLALLAGLYSMWRGGDFTRKWSNKLMRLRVLLQALAILIIMIGFWLSRQHA